MASVLQDVTSTNPFVNGIANGTSHLMREMEKCLRVLERGTAMTKFFPKRKMEDRNFFVRLETRQILWQRSMIGKYTYEGSGMSNMQQKFSELAFLDR